MSHYVLHHTKLQYIGSIQITRVIIRYSRRNILSDVQHLPKVFIPFKPFCILRRYVHNYGCTYEFPNYFTDKILKYTVDGQCLYPQHVKVKQLMKRNKPGKPLRQNYSPIFRKVKDKSCVSTVKYLPNNDQPF